MPDYAVHAVEYDDTTREDWSAPAASDFETNDLGEIDDHFLLSSSGFPPENYGDLQLPLVDPAGTLNLHALEAAYAGGHSVETVDGIDDETVGEAKGLIQRLASDAFDHEIG